MPPARSISRRDRIPQFLFGASIVLAIFGYGVAVGAFRWFPYRFFELAADGLRELETRVIARRSPGELGKWGSVPWYFTKAAPRPAPDPNLAGSRQPGLTLITQMDASLRPAAFLIDDDGHEVQRWDLDWFRLWPEADHIPAELVPRSEPGTHVHGAVVLENGDLVFNFEHLGLVRINRSNEVVWRLPYATHHSVHLHDDGTLWVCGQKRHETASPRFPGRLPPFDEYTLLEVSQAGDILHEWSVGDLLRENGLAGLLELHSAVPHEQLLDDRLHLNDVEPFPDSFAEGFFRHGDVLVSLRNINTILVFNRATREIRFSCTGWFDAQHDPDFVDGDHFSVFDNHASSKFTTASSRIVMVSARERKSRVIYEGTESAPFFSKIMGKHQWLPNGNLLVTEACQGRAFELDPQGRIVWDYRNFVDDGMVTLVEQAERLSPEGCSPPTQNPFQRYDD